MILPYFPMFPADFEADTSHLTLEEDGAYNRLLRLMWMTPGCSLPDDATWIARRMRVDQSAYDGVVAPIISEFFKRSQGRVFSPRLMQEFKKADKTSKLRREAGMKGGRPQTIENKQKEQKPGLSRAKAGLTYPEPYPDTEEEKKEPSGSFQKKAAKRGERIGDFEPDLSEASRLGLSPSQAKTERDKFRDFWISKPGAGGVKLDWPATWRNWCRTAAERQPGQRQSRPPPREDGFDKAIREELERANGHGQQFGDFRHSIEIEPDRDHSSAVFAQIIAASGSGH